jgi:hypothetical protein
MYTPHEYTHQQKGKPFDYPGKWGRAFLARLSHNASKT